ncbi:MAG: hypothetical protein WC408_03995 [Candidatus Micrarchaeia archaeon]|jgi:hypothetical protein
MQEHYSREITDQTKDELAEFIRWFNKIFGHAPLIVGGWAAWAYHHGLGSKDIDVVFPGSAAMHRNLVAYYAARGFSQRKTEMFDYEFFKERKTREGMTVDVMVDAVASNRFVTVTGTKLVIPWGLAEKNKRMFEFAKNAEAYIVTPDLLLFYKVGALIGRSHLLRQTTSKTHYQSKLWKDAQDVAGLLRNCEIDVANIRQFSDQCRFKKSDWQYALGAAQAHLDDAQKNVVQDFWARLDVL